MKHFNKLCVSLAVFLGIIAVSAPISALAADSNNKANYFPTQQYVSDTYKADEAYTAKVEESKGWLKIFIKQQYAEMQN